MGLQFQHRGRGEWEQGCQVYSALEKLVWELNGLPPSLPPANSRGFVHVFSRKLHQKHLVFTKTISSAPGPVHCCAQPGQPLIGYLRKGSYCHRHRSSKRTQWVSLTTKLAGAPKHSSSSDCPHTDSLELQPLTTNPSWSVRTSTVIWMWWLCRGAIRKQKKKHAKHSAAAGIWTQVSGSPGWPSY